MFQVHKRMNQNGTVILQDPVEIHLHKTTGRIYHCIHVHDFSGVYMLEDGFVPLLFHQWGLFVVKPNPSMVSTWIASCPSVLYNHVRGDKPDLHWKAYLVEMSRPRIFGRKDAETGSVFWSPHAGGWTMISAQHTSFDTTKRVHLLSVQVVMENLSRYLTILGWQIILCWFSSIILFSRRCEDFHLRACGVLTHQLGMSIARVVCPKKACVCVYIYIYVCLYIRICSQNCHFN